MSALQTLMANMRHAVWNKIPAQIGGGEFSPDEIDAAYQEIVKLITAAKQTLNDLNPDGDMPVFDPLREATPPDAFNRTLANRWHLPIISAFEAREFIRNLVAKGLEFHPDDDPADIVVAATGERLFTDEEVPYIAARIAECREVLDDEDEIYTLMMGE